MPVDAVDQTNYIARSRASIEALKSANLLKSLNINALIVGQRGVGKQTLAKFILPKAPIVDGADLQELLGHISSTDNVIVKNFEKISNYQKIHSAVEVNKTRIIATTSKEIPQKLSDDFFSLKITIDPLSQREEDIEPLAKKFFQEVSTLFGTDSDSNISLNDFNFDVSKNCYSLRKSVYLHYLIDSLEETDVMQVMEEFLTKRIGGKNDYREQLYLFDVPLIRSGFKKFHSQLAISEKFGLNRNTLRKKINDYKDHYKLD
jgi:DNA-binding NtrC family response regulator